MYVKLVSEIMKRHNIKYHCYGDDIDVYATLKMYNKWDDVSSILNWSLYSGHKYSDDQQLAEIEQR